MKNTVPKLSATIFLLLASGTGALGQEIESVRPRQKRPNIIFIMTDDHSRNAMSAYSRNLTETPNLDRIAEKGIKFNNAFVTNALCGPSRAVLLTGKFSHKNGFKSNDRDVFDGNQPSLPKHLQAAGYYTAIVGKWHLGSKPQGFDQYDILIDQGEYYAPRFFNGKDTIVEAGYVTEVITEKAIQILEKGKSSGRPILLMVHEKGPHRNWMPNVKDLAHHTERVFDLPATFFDEYDTRSSAAFKQDMKVENMYLGYDLKLELRNPEDETGTGGDARNNAFTWLNYGLSRMDGQERALWDRYYRPISAAYYSNSHRNADNLAHWKYNRYMNDYLLTVKSVDDEVGKLLDYLDHSGLAENTLVIYTSDQGFFLGEHGWYDKRFMYEPSLEIPLVMSYPGHIKENTQQDAIVQNVDFAPTMLSIAGVEVPSDMQGESLLPLLAGKKPKDWRTAIYYRYYENPEGVHHVERHLGIRTNRYKLIYFHEVDEWELYDLKKDPQEVRNVFDEKNYSSVKTKLKHRLKKLMSQYDDTVDKDID
ncbi:sulfatase [Parapedobacter sp. 2B3]|uniref:sulfatase family protein n=1 Tax=Parapedobacter sp. 2B3 TaxID=3342381 RepID=UPI0035B5C3DE